MKNLILFLVVAATSFNVEAFVVRWSAGGAVSRHESSWTPASHARRHGRVLKQSSTPVEVEPLKTRTATLRRIGVSPLEVDPQVTNALVLTALLIGASFGLLHHDFDQLSALPANADRVKAAVAMLQTLPTEWLAWYDDEALTFPLMTKASTSGTCYFLGDLCAQLLSGKNLSTIRLDRATRSALAGFIGHGPIAHYWLGFLDTYLSFDGAWWSPIPKILLDQGPMSIVYNTIYSLLLGAFAFRDVRHVMHDVKEAFVPGFLASIKFWPLVHLVTFSVIPVELQLLWIDAAEIIWVCILSGVNNEGISHVLDDEVEVIQ